MKKIGVRRFRILGGGGAKVYNIGVAGAKGDKIPSRHMTS